MTSICDTVALMLTVASPKPSDVEIQLRAGEIQRGIERLRRAAAVPASGKRASLVYAFPPSIDPRQLRRVVEQMRDFAVANGYIDDPYLLEGTGFLGIDAVTKDEEATIQANALRFLQDRMRTSELHPDVWRAIVVFDPAETCSRSISCGPRACWRRRSRSGAPAASGGSTPASPAGRSTTAGSCFWRRSRSWAVGATCMRWSRGAGTQEGRPSTG